MSLADVAQQGQEAAQPKEYMQRLDHAFDCYFASCGLGGKDSTMDRHERAAARGKIMAKRGVTLAAMPTLAVAEEVIGALNAKVAELVEAARRNGATCVAGGPPAISPASKS